jgi:anti-sigma factor RsiW
MNDHLSNDRLVDFVHGELSPADDALAHAHLAVCALCRENYELEALLSEALRSAAKAEEVDMPSLVAAAVWQRVRAATPGPLARLAGWLRPAVAVPLAAAVLLAGFIVSPLAHRAGPTIDATYYFAAHAAQTGGTPLSERPSGLVLETSMNASSSSAPVTDALDGYATTSSLDDVR